MVGEPGGVSARSDVAREGPDDQRFWARHVRISTVLYGLCCATILGYAAATGDEPYRAALALVVVVSMGAAILFDRARWYVARSPHRMRLLYGWSALTLSLVITVSWLDGGANSPLCLLLFIALNYVALAYPPRALVALAIAAMAAYLLLAVLGSDTDTWPRLLMSTMMIGLSGYLGALAARNHWSQAEAQTALSSALAQLATSDHLTGCLNRRAFDSRLAAEVDQAHRLGRGLSVLLIDVDHFKQVNDGHGHLIGDQVLSGLSAALRDACRAGDIVGRIGGDEFALILPDTTGEVAAALGDRLRVAAADLHLPVPVTLSIGAAQLTRGVDTSLRLLQAADLALYDVKSAGRDAVALHREPPGTPCAAESRPLEPGTGMRRPTPTVHQP
jgi:diguanylate cyclase (GGDEF)-like protein